MRAALFLLLVAAAAPQTTRKPTTSGTLLTLPELEYCQSRPKNWQHGNHYYFFSWDVNDPDLQEVDPKTGQTKGIKVNWLEARNICRRYCMDAIGMETEAENNMVFDFMARRNITYIWTSGRLCDFTGCNERKDLFPLNIYGWFWSNTNTKMAPTNSTPPGWAYQPWSNKGHFGGPQPDNAEFQINNTTESCMAVLNNIYKDGMKWHDIACYHKKPVICEDSDVLLDYIEKKYNVEL